MTSKDPAENCIFELGMQIREITPSTPQIIEISRLMYNELLHDYPMMKKAILPEYIDYYCTAMVWFRIVSLKSMLFQTITPCEEKLLLLLDQQEFKIPEPLLLQLKMLGFVRVGINMDMFKPRFPELPTNRVAGHGGYYGPINVNTHNLYEEIPCLGVLAEAIRQSISDVAPGLYASALSAEGIVPNANLLGYLPLGERQPEAKTLAHSCGITATCFPESPNGAGINMKLLFRIATFLSTTETFKLSTLIFKTMSQNGSVIQATIQKNLKSLWPGRLEKNDELTVTSFVEEKISILGAAIMFTPQLWKTSSKYPSSWACINHPPLTFIANRNERRTALYYREESKYKSNPVQNGRKYKKITIRRMRQTPRKLLSEGPF